MHRGLAPSCNFAGGNIMMTPVREAMSVKFCKVAGNAYSTKIGAVMLAC